MSFQDIKQKYNLDNHDHYRYLQVRHFFDKVKHKINLDKNGFIRAIVETYNSKKFRIISTMYRHLMERKGNTTTYIKLKWERELGVNI